MSKGVFFEEVSSAVLYAAAIGGMYTAYRVNRERDRYGQPMPWWMKIWLCTSGMCSGAAIVHLFGGAGAVTCGAVIVTEEFTWKTRCEKNA